MALLENALGIVPIEPPDDGLITRAFQTASLIPSCPRRIDIDRIPTFGEPTEAFMWTTLSGVNPSNVGQSLSNDSVRREKIEESADLLCQHYYNLRYIPYTASFDQPTPQNLEAYAFNIKGYFSGYEDYKSGTIRATSFENDELSLANLQTYLEETLGWDASLPFTVNHLYEPSAEVDAGLPIYPSEPFERDPCGVTRSAIIGSLFFEPLASRLIDPQKLYYNNTFIGYGLAKLESWNPNFSYIGVDCGRFTGAQATICIGSYITENSVTGPWVSDNNQRRDLAYIQLGGAHFVCEATALGTGGEDVSVEVSAEDASASGTNGNNLTAEVAVDISNLSFWTKYTRDP